MAPLDPALTDKKVPILADDEPKFEENEHISEVDDKFEKSQTAKSSASKS